jgi:hypothetical protein
MLVAGGWWLVAGGGWLVAGGWWPVVGGRWLVAGGWWLVAGGWWLVAAKICANLRNLRITGSFSAPLNLGTKPAQPTSLFTTAGIQPPASTVH